MVLCAYCAAKFGTCEALYHHIADIHGVNEVPVNARSEVERKARAYDALTAALLLLGQLSSQSIRNILERQK